MLNGSKIGDGHWFFVLSQITQLLIMKMCFCQNQSRSFRCALSGYTSMGCCHHLLLINGIEYQISNSSYMKIDGGVSRVSEGHDGSVAVVLVLGEGERRVEFYVSLAGLHNIPSWRSNVTSIRRVAEEIKRKNLLPARDKALDNVDTPSEYQGVFAFD